MSIALNAANLEKHYGNVRAVDDVSFRVATGEVVGLIGPNGAGKTSTIRMLTGYLEPTAGRVSVLGVDAADDPRGVRRALGYLPEHVPLYPDLRVAEYVDHRARLKGLRGRTRRQRVDAALGRLHLQDVRRQLVGTLSKGYRQRVGLAAVLVNEPRVLVLDEPTVGLDPTQTRDLRGLIGELSEERTILISSHLLPELERVVDRVLLMHGGRLIADGAPAALLGGDTTIAELEIAAEAPAFEEAVRGLDGVASVTVTASAEPADWRRLVIEADRDVRADVAALLRAHDVSFRELAGGRRDLETVFHRLVAEASDAAGASERTEARTE